MNLMPKKHGGKRRNPKHDSKSSLEHKDQSTINIIEDPKENVDPNTTPLTSSATFSIQLNESPMIKLDKLKDITENLVTDDLDGLTNDHLKLLQQDVQDIDYNLSNIASILKKKFKVSLSSFINEPTALKFYSNLKLPPSCSSKGPLQSEYLLNKTISLNLFKSANSEFDLLLAYLMFTMNSNLLCIQEQMILNRVGNELTLEMIQDSENAIVAAKKEMEDMAKLKFKDYSAISQTLKEYEIFLNSFVTQTDDFLNEDAEKIKHISNSYELLKQFTDDRFIKNEKKIDKLFGLMRKINGRANGLYKLINYSDNEMEEKPPDPKTKRSKSLPDDSYETIEDPDDKSNSFDEEEEEEDDEDDIE